MALAGSGKHDRVVLQTEQPDLVVADPRRLRVLADTGLLDSPPEEVFDRMTRLAANLISVPVTFLSLVDKHRDFYKSHSGFDEPLASTRQVDGRTFCHYTLVSDGPLVIEDTTAHPLFRNVPTVKTLGIHAYAGVPLVVDGHSIGSFCAIDFAPRKWSQLDIETLQELARAALREIGLRRLANEAQQRARAGEAILLTLEQELPNALQMVNMALHALGEATPSTQPTLLAEARTASNAVVDLTNNLLELSRLQTARVHLRLQTHDAASLLQDAIELLQPAAARRGIALDVIAADEKPVTADYQYLLRALCQLGGHAIKVTPENGRVELTVNSTDDGIRFAIADQGSRLPSNVADYFGPDLVQRASAMTFSMAGALIKAHGGLIHVAPADAGNLVQITLLASAPEG